MKTIELVGQVDEHHRLQVEVPHDIPPGPVKVLVGVGEEDAADWGRAVLRRWAEESDDPCEDIYTLDDGVPCRPGRS